MPVPEQSASRSGRVRLTSTTRPLVAAVVFLTRVPLPERARLTGCDVARGAVAFPVVGAALGGMLGGVAALLAPFVTPMVAGALAVAVELAATGALHVDGLADSADALAGRDREHRLAIMRDHALGAYGTAALTLNLLVKAAAVAALAASGTTATVIAVAAAVFAVSRAAPLPLAAVLPYARREHGTGLLLTQRLGARRAAAGVALAVAVGTALTAVTGAVRLAGVAGVVVVPACLVAVTAAVVVCVGCASQRLLGGVTGDVMGAAIELTATLGLVAAAGVRA